VDIGAFEAGGVATAYPLTITLVGKGSVSMILDQRVA
jgi:hypothetical protein